MTSKRNLPRRCPPNDELSRIKYITPFVDAAIAPLGRYLNVWQARLVRSIVEAAIEVDPVSRRLLASVLRSRLHVKQKASATKRDREDKESELPHRTIRIKD